MGISPLEKILFTEHLSLMLKSGVSISETLETLKEEVKSRAFKKALEDILKEILNGRSLSHSLKRHPKIFDSFFCNVVNMGERTGRLAENLKFLSIKLTKENELRGKIRGAMIYPLILIFVAMIVVSLAVFFLLPKLIPLFQLIGIKLPLPTRILISILTFIKKYWPWIPIGIFSFSLFIKILHSFKLTRFYLDKTFLSLPLLGPFLKNLNLAHFSRSLYILFKSGLSMRESLELCSLALQNQVYKVNLNFLISEIKRGEKIGQVLKRFKKNFPPFFSQIILIGERTGNLDECLLYLAQFYEEKVSLDFKRLSAIIEPALTIFMGILVGFIALAVITPIYRFLGEFRFR